MPWAEEDAVALKTRFVHAFNAPGANRAEVCRRFGVSRETGYASSQRYHQHGEAGLTPTSSAPHEPGNVLSNEVVELILAFRLSSPNQSWAADIILQLWRDNLDVPPPSRASVTRVLQQYDLSHAHRPKRYFRSTRMPSPATCSNDAWAIDGKGLWRGVAPLTVFDVYSRYLFAAEVVPVDIVHVQRVLGRLFDELGLLPRRVRCDGGTPFGGSGFGQLTQLALWLVDLGVVVEHVGKAQHNGHLERLHRTLEQEAPQTMSVARALQQFRGIYNELRPHSKLDGKAPVEVYKPQGVAPRAEIIARYDDERSVRSNGYFKWKGQQLFISEALVSRTVTFRILEEGLWLVRYRHLPIALLDERTMKLRRCPRDVFENFT